jgi:hypothetical protein
MVSSQRLWPSWWSATAEEGFIVDASWFGSSS